MADNWRILDLSFLKGRIAFNKKRRVLEILNEETGEVSVHPLGDVNIIFIGISVMLAPAVPYHLTSADVVAIFCDWRGMPIASMYPWTDAHGRVAARQRAQASLSLPRSKNAWMKIIKAKIRGQANVLDGHGRDGASKLREIANSVKSGDPDNREGYAARLYWRYLFNDPSFRRNPGAKENGWNGLLDYGYMILRGHSMRAVLSAGLTPALGLHHKGRSNSFALADDLIEPFRPIVDDVVASIGKDGLLIDKNTRRTLLQVCAKAFGSADKTAPSIMIEFSQQYGRYVEGEIPIIDVPVYNPKLQDNEN